MIRTTISIPDEEFQEIKRLAARTDRSISWLLRQAFRLAKPRLESGVSYAETFDRVWAEIGGVLRESGIHERKVGQLIATVRSGKSKTKARTGKR